jgi:hypothetical protein
MDSAPGPQAGTWTKRAALSVAMALVAVNVWTGSPLLALWLGSRVQSSGPATIGGVFAVIAAMGLFSFILLRALALLGRRYDELSGKTRTTRTHAPWLRSMRGERELYPGDRPTVTMPERVLVVTVVIAVLAFEIWFFFYSGSSIDQRSGRGTGAVQAPGYALVAPPRDLR